MAKTGLYPNLLQTIQQAEKHQAEAQESSTSLEKELASVCEGQTLEEVAAKFNLLDKQIKSSNMKLAIAKQAEEYCKAYSAMECPVCLAKYSADGLIEKARLSIEQASPEQAALVKKLNCLRVHYEKALELSTKLNELTEWVQKTQKERDSAISQIRSLLEASGDLPFSEEDAQARLSAIEGSVRTLENTLESAESRYTEWRKRIEALRSELRFHKYREAVERLQRQLTSGIEPMHDRLKELVELETTVHDIKETLGQAFNEAIDGALPHLNRMMTEVYQRLTGQISFERMYIQRTDGYGGQILQVSVGSDRLPDQLFDPEDVLNGQANSALRLVPYFVFSQFQAEALELDLLLIDDPSQSFDTSHIQFLLQEFVSAGSHAQLVIATHEDERFSPHLNKYFRVGTYEVIRFTEFDPKKGPSFGIDR